MFNEVIIIGKLAKEPTIKETQSGIKVATMILDVERPYKNNLGIRDHDYISCVIWKGMCQQVIDCCKIGSFLGVKGRIQTKTVNTSETLTSTIMEVKVEHVEFLDKFLKYEH